MVAITKYTVKCLSVFAKRATVAACICLFTAWLSLPLIHFKNEMGVKQEPAYVSNKNCHEQNRHIPSPVVICTICPQFSWGLSKLTQLEWRIEKASNVQLFKCRVWEKLSGTGYVNPMQKCWLILGQSLVVWHISHWLSLTSPTTLHSTNYSYRL